jgi:hypothetical protein
MAISATIIQSFRAPLNDHPVYAAVSDVEDLRVFMRHHVFSVWDFMSLIKYLQHQIAPAAWPWRPLGDGNVRRFINELVLEEESDLGYSAPGHDPYEHQSFASHFELYCAAMREVGADDRLPLEFVERVGREGLQAALAHPTVPAPSRRFTAATFEFIASAKPHVVAAALALGREHIIPSMFRALLGRIAVTEERAPIFHLYLNRHIQLDEDFHAPLSLRLLNALCEGDATKEAEAIEAARQAVQRRLEFWDGVTEAIQAARAG